MPKFEARAREQLLLYMLRAKRGFAQSQDCPAQTLDPWFVVQSMDWPRNPGIARAQSMDQDNPGIALRKAYIDQTNPWYTYQVL